MVIAIIGILVALLLPPVQGVYTAYFGKMGHVKDGLSNLIVFGEVIPDCSGHVLGGWHQPHGFGLCSTLITINYDSCAVDAASAPNRDGCRARCNWNMEFGFRSPHSGGAQFAMGDGSVHFISQSIDHWVYNRLGDKCDGQPASLP